MKRLSIKVVTVAVTVTENTTSGDCLYSLSWTRRDCRHVVSIGRRSTTPHFLCGFTPLMWLSKGKRVLVHRDPRERMGSWPKSGASTRVRYRQLGKAYPCVLWRGPKFTNCASHST